MSRYRKKQGRKIGIVLAIVLVIGVLGFLFTNGILAFNQENLGKSVQKISESIPNYETNEPIPKSETNELVGGFIETIPNKIKVGLGHDEWLYGEFTPYNLKVIENPRYDKIKFSIKATIIDLAFDESVWLDGPKTHLVDENSKKYIANLLHCLDESDTGYWISGKKTDTTLFNVCYDVDKESKKFDIMYSGIITVGETSNIVKIGTIHINN